MPDCVDARMQAVQPTRLKAVLDRSLPHPEFDQLPPPHYPVLLSSKLRHPRIGPSFFPSLSQRSYSGS